jgi:hypothetical protein
MKIYFRKRILLFISLIISALVVGASHHLLDINIHEKPISITITATGDKNENSNGSEVWITEIKLDGNLYDMSSIKYTDNWEFRNGALLSYKDRPASLNLVLPGSNKLEVTLLKHDWSGLVSIDYGDRNETIDLYSKYRSSYKHIINNTNLVHLGLSSLLATIVIAFIIFLFLRLSCYKPIFFGFLCSIIAIFLGYSLKNVDTPSLFVIYSIAILAGMKFAEMIGTGEWKEFLQGRWRMLFFVAITLFSSFSLVGNDLFFEFSFLNFTVKNVSLFLLTSLVVFPIELFILYLFKKWHGRLNSNQYYIFNPILLWFIFFVIISLIWSIYLCAFYPALMSADSMDQWQQALGLSPLTDWHPAFHTITIKWLMHLYQYPSIVSIVQIIFAASVVSSFLLFLCTKGLPIKFAIIIATVFPALPNNGVNIVTLWKDIPYTVSLLWLTLVLGKLIFDSNKFSKSFVNLLSLIGALCSVGLFRHNGIIVFFLSVIFLLVFAIKYKNIKYVVSILMACLILFLIKGPLFTYYQVSPTPAGIKFTAPIHGVGSTVYHEKNISPKTLSFLENIMPVEDWVLYYSPYTANPYLFNTPNDFMKKLSSHSTPEILNIYMESLIRNPIIVLYDRLEGVNLIWDIAQSGKAYNYRYADGIIENNVGITGVDNFLTKNINEILEVSSRIQVVDALLWRGGIYTVFLLLIIYYILLFGLWDKLVLFIPVIGNIVSLIFSMAWQDYRYVYFEFFITGFILLYVLLIQNNKSSEQVESKYSNCFQGVQP